MNTDMLTASQRAILVLDNLDMLASIRDHAERAAKRIEFRSIAAAGARASVGLGTVLSFVSVAK